MSTKISRFKKAISLFQNTEDLNKALIEFNNLYGLEHSVLYISKNTPDIIGTPFIKTTYPTEWVGRYFQKNYSYIDPIVRVSMTTSEPFDWHLIEKTADEQKFMEEAAEYGVGVNGFSIPYWDNYKRFSMFTISSNRVGNDWNFFIADLKDELILIGQQLHTIALIDAGFDQTDLPQLSKRQIEVLSLSAHGKNYHEIAEELSISEHTVRDYMKEIREKLDCRSLIQAVAKAVRLKLINI